jgi:hypothetical protein
LLLLLLLLLARRRGGERSEPGSAHSGAGGGDRDRARARRSRRGSEEEGEDGAVCGPAAGTEEEERAGEEKTSCSQASHPRRVKTATKKRNAILAENCDGICMCMKGVRAGERREGTGGFAVYILGAWELCSSGRMGQ